MHKTTVQEENICACNTVHWCFVKYSHKTFPESVSLIRYLALERCCVVLNQGASESEVRRAGGERQRLSSGKDWFCPNFSPPRCINGWAEYCREQRVHAGTGHLSVTLAACNWASWRSSLYWRSIRRAWKSGASRISSVGPALRGREPFWPRRRQFGGASRTAKRRQWPGLSTG